ncbi:uncharacterized protein LOC123548373 isoform X2 [Mercenaria mercenaria]|uniref:uncharacterized protein LOC123548373 isoform X2 n=1 Tax=Mercenaria mercenaria TaxID=6596 RepID=UPI001E1E20BD|nr:uncharacterized protein LOC123548373 isoform X2 [Mercenaria mercenaria]
MPKRKQQEELCQQVQRKRTSGQGGGDSVQEQAGVPSDLTVGAPLNLSSPVKVKTHNVWIIGDSLIRGAQQAAYLRPDEDLGLGYHPSSWLEIAETFEFATRCLESQ